MTAAAARDDRITGTRGTIPYFVRAGVTCPAPDTPGAQDWAAQGVEGLKQFDPSNLKTTGFLASQQMHIEADGTFELILSQNDPGAGKNWLRLTPDTNCIMIRLVFGDRGCEVAPAMTIERMDHAAPEPVTPALIADGLAWPGPAGRGYAELVRNWWQGTQGNVRCRSQWCRAGDHCGNRP